MKDVSEILAKRLQRLEQPFSREWIIDFSSLMGFIPTNSFTQQILDGIKKEKTQAHDSLIRNLKNLLIDSQKCLKEIGDQIKVEKGVDDQIDRLLKFKINSNDIESPFFELESLYYDYCRGFDSLFRSLAQDDANIFITEYCIISCIKLQEKVHLKIDLTFSPYLQKCKQDIEILSGQRAASIWGKWDVLLKWADWTKNGISPSNHAYEQNLQHLFVRMKTATAVQTCGLFFLEHLADKKTITTNTEICLKAIELHLDEKDQYWVIAHFSGENGEKKEFFIKKLRKEARSYELLMLLLQTEPYSTVEFPKLTHTLGELGIKNELKKLFFPQDKFAGSFVRTAETDQSIDAASVIKELTRITNERKHRPSFDWGYYHRSSFVTA